MEQNVEVKDDFMDAHRTEIGELIEQYRRGFATLDAQLLQSLWDSDYDVIYVPIEKAEPIRGWLAIAHYYEQLNTIFSHADMMEIGDLSVDVLGDIGIAYFTFRFVGQMIGRSEPFRVMGRNTLIVRRTGEGWKGIHYHESRVPIA
jgi:ketosteroid isomerase-like protein